MIDSVVEAVRADLLRRSELGIAKYGTTLDRADLNLRDWLQHAYEETLDQANYLKRAIIEIDAGTYPTAPHVPDVLVTDIGELRRPERDL